MYISFLGSHDVSRYKVHLETRVIQGEVCEVLYVALILITI